MADEVAVSFHVLDGHGSLSDGVNEGNRLRLFGVGPSGGRIASQRVTVDFFGVGGKGVAHVASQVLLTKQVAIGIHVLNGDGSLGVGVVKRNGLWDFCIGPVHGWFSHQRVAVVCAGISGEGIVDGPGHGALVQYGAVGCDILHGHGP